MKLIKVVKTKQGKPNPECKLCNGTGEIKSGKTTLWCSCGLRFVKET